MKNRIKNLRRAKLEKEIEQLMQDAKDCFKVGTPYMDECAEKFIVFANHSKLQLSKI